MTIIRKMTSRRDFIRNTSALTIGAMYAGAACSVSANAFDKADLIISGGNILTMDPQNPTAEAVAVRDGRILAVGALQDIFNLKSTTTRVIDARGKTVTPGFIDAHTHPLAANEATGVNVNLPSISDVQKVLAKKASQTPPGVWIEGVMYDDTKFIENRPLNRLDIDAVVKSHPVFVAHRGGHTAVVNTKAYEVAGITLSTPDPSGGKFYRENGQFTGKVAEKALGFFRNAGEWPAVTRAGRQQAVALISKRMASNGLTSITDALGFTSSLIAFQDARDAGDLNFRVSFMPGAFEYASEPAAYSSLKAAGIRSGFGDDMIRIGAVKYSADGSASERTMRMSTPFKGRNDDYGILTMSQEEIDAAVDDAVANRYRIGIHANGDVTIDMVLKSYERVLRHWRGPNPRFRIEHCSLVNPQLLRRIKSVGAIPTPFYTYAHFHGNKWGEYGQEKMEWMFAHRAFIDAGIPVAPASDYTPGPYEPMMALQSMVTRKDVHGRVWGGSQRITVQEALQVCTVNGAYSSFEEDSKGSIIRGKLADLVILDKSPFEVDPDNLKKIKIVRTILGGKTIYEA